MENYVRVVAWVLVSAENHTVGRRYDIKQAVTISALRA